MRLDDINDHLGHFGPDQLLSPPARNKKYKIINNDQLYPDQVRTPKARLAAQPAGGVCQSLHLPRLESAAMAL